MDSTKLKGNIRLEHSARNNEYYAYDENGFVCGSTGINKEKMEEMIKRSNQYSDLIDYLRNIEQFEADLIMCNEAWNTVDGMPKLTKEFYDRWIELQSLRNKLLGNGLGKAKTYDEIVKE